MKNYDDEIALKKDFVKKKILSQKKLKLPISTYY